VCVFCKCGQTGGGSKGVESGFFFLDQFALGDNAVNAANENKRRDLISFFQKIYFHAATTTILGEKLQKRLQSKLQGSVC